jgi:hypothetical protein
MRKQLIISCLLLLVALQTAFAQTAEYKRYKEALQTLKTIKKYAYKSEIESVMNDGSFDKIATTLYVDKSKQCLFMENEGSITVINQEQILQIDHVAKVVKLFDKQTYQKKYDQSILSLQKYFANNIMDFYLDSVLAKINTVRAFNKDDHTVFSLQFPDGNMFGKFELGFNEKRKQPVSMQVLIFGSSQMKSHTASFKVYAYQFDFTDAVFQTGSYVKKTNNKYYLLKYKNYKLITD